jgi:pimeloyl-ACP methyl ester carboxylesterase
VSEVPGEDPPIVHTHGIPDVLATIRAWKACLFGSSNAHDELVDSGALGDVQVPVSVIFGESDRYLSPSLAREIAGLFTESSLYVVPGASHWPQRDQSGVLADLLTDIASAKSST